LFLKERTAIGTATKRFSARLRTLVSSHCEEIKTWAVPERIKGHSGRKGTATYLTAATLNPPPLPSIAHRGEWSQGKVQDIYFNFAQPGDHYIGRMLAGLNPTSPSFKVLPPHFICGLENKYVKEGVELCYGRILKTRQNLDYLPGVFLLLLASVVYHEKWIRGFVLDNKKHPFSNLFLLENLDLIRNLEALVTTEPTENMPRPTGIPTHIDLQSTMEEILINNNRFLEKLELQSTIIQEAVKKAIKENDVASGTVTMPILTEQLDNHHKSIIEFIQANCSKLSNDSYHGNNNNNNGKLADNSELLFVPEFQKGTEKCPMYCYNGKFWDVPKKFQFQKNPTRKVGWEYWIKGKPNNEMLVNNIIQKAPLKPFRRFIRDRLPKKEQNVFSSTWKPIFTYMEKTPNLDIPNNPDEISADIIDQTFDQATEYMKQNVSYIWNLKNSTIHNWTICTWSKYVSHGYVENLGSESDKLHHKTYSNFRCLPRKKNRKALPSLINSPNNNDPPARNGTDNRNNNNQTKRRRLTFTADKGNIADKQDAAEQDAAEQQSVDTDLFGAAVAPNPVYLEASRKNDHTDSDESNNEGNEAEKEQNEQLTVRTNFTNVPNTGVASVESFSAAVSTILEAAGIDTSSHNDSNGEAGQCTSTN
jgi:hypothetical protein